MIKLDMCNLRVEPKVMVQILHRQAQYLQKKRHVKRENFNRVFPKLQMEHLAGLCMEPYN